MPATVWAKLGLAALCIAAVVGFVVYPTYPNYDSYYYLLWAREALHLQHLSFAGFRTPTEHPLAILVSLPLALIGKGGDRVFLFAILASFVVLCAGMYRLGRLTFGPVAGATAVALLCTRFDFPFLAARGYVDIPYLAIVIWAAALEVARPRRGVPVFLLLAAASLIRPEAWILAGMYWLWCCWGATWRQRAIYTVLAAIGPVIWLALDQAVTGDALFSLHHTGDTAEALGRAKGLSAVPAAIENFLLQLDKGPAVIAAVAGFAVAAWYAPRKLPMPAVLFLYGIGTFVAVGLAGLSIIERYLLVPSLMVMLFAGAAIGGWDMLTPGGRLRRAWAIAAGVAVVGGVLFSLARVNLSSIDFQLRYRGDAHRALSALLDKPQVRAGMACGAVSVPTHKLVPDVRWLTNRHYGAGGVVARTDPAQVAQRAEQRGVAIVVNTQFGLINQVFTDGTVSPLANNPPPGFRLAAGGPYYAAYVRC